MESDMNLEEIYFISQIAVGVAIIFSILFVAIELRQNSYLLKKSMADVRAQRVNWLFETLCVDNDFRDFHRRIDTDFENFDEDEKYRAICLGIRSLGSMLDELAAYFEGNISDEEWVSLQWNMKFAATRPNFEPAYQFIKDGYPEKVQKFWESLAKESRLDEEGWLKKSL
tara:strand:- start:304 stop:813 length:510 start_codon:yes stop_codon:yes gene_type:complete